MNEIVVATQAELDAIPADFAGLIVIKGNVVVSRYWDNASVEARGNASVEAWGNASVVARDNASVVAWDNASVEARDNASVEARDNASVEAWGNASVVARDNASVEARNRAMVQDMGYGVITLHGHSVCTTRRPGAITVVGAHALIQEYRDEPYIEREGVEEHEGCITLYKRVSANWLTQEGTERETQWTVGATLEHTAWAPEVDECGSGKFRACSRPYFCDEFRGVRGDRYVALRVALADIYEWPAPQRYPHKVAVRRATVLYECDRWGREIKT
jgi:hypothetical protein